MLSGQKLIAVHMVQKNNKSWYVIHLPSYAGPTSYSSTYYNPGDYQTAGGYPSNSFTHQTTTWNGSNYANYTLSNVQTILKIHVGLMPLVMQVQILCIISIITSNGLIITIKRKLVVPLEQKMSVASTSTQLPSPHNFCSTLEARVRFISNTIVAGLSFCWMHGPRLAEFMHSD